MVANQHIKSGTRILTDQILFSVADNTVDEGLEERISRSFNQLSQRSQNLFNSLHCPRSAKWSPLVSRYLANSFELSERTTGKEPLSALFLEASRINHSCCPNAFFAWNPNLGELTIHAIVSIYEREEITVAYDFPFKSRDTRRRRLHELYGFQCQCPACRLMTDSDRRSEQRHQQMESLFNAIEKHQERPKRNDDKGLTMVIDFITLACEEGIDGQFLSSMFERASMHYEARGELTTALMFADLAFERDTRLLGLDHPMTIDSRRFVAVLLRSLQSQRRVQPDRSLGPERFLLERYLKSERDRLEREARPEREVESEREVKLEKGGQA